MEDIWVLGGRCFVGIDIPPPPPSNEKKRSMGFKWSTKSFNLGSLTG